jgi:hydrogenase maturation protease
VTTLWIGFGNPLRRDDGVGARAAAMLAAEGLPARAWLQPLPELALEIAAAQRVVFLDADLALAPGHVQLRVVTASPPAPWSHRLDAAGLLSLVRLVAPRPPAAWTLSIGILDADAGEDLSPPVEAGLGELLARARRFADPGWQPPYPSAPAA